MMRKTCRQSLVLVGGRCLSLGDTDDVITTYEKHLASRGNSTSSARTDAGDELDGQSLRLTGIHLSQADGLPSQGAVPIQSEKPATIRITYQSARPQQIGRLDVRIVRDDGTLCCAVDGSLGMGHDGERLDEIGGQGEFRVTLDPFQLTTGRYSVFVEISDPTDSTALVSGQSGYFGVFTQRALPNPGVFVPRTFFEHYRLREVDAAGEREPAEPETGVVDRR